jgi:Glycosyl-4,4'-diaponeurosporenoate acyltransferase
VQNLKSVLALVLATALLALVLVWAALEVGVSSVAFALVVAWVPNGWMVVAFSVRPLSLPKGYYQLRKFERRLYECLGIRIFSRLLGSRLYVRLVPEFSDSARRGSLVTLEKLACHAETAHLLVFFLALPFAGFSAWTGQTNAAVWGMVFNILLNAYPVMLQRYNRGRIQKLLSPQKITFEFK